MITLFVKVENLDKTGQKSLSHLMKAEERCKIHYTKTEVEILGFGPV